MREIKFRAWDRTSDIMRADISSIDYDGSGKVAQINVVTGADILFPDKEVVLMQYTGLKDKNGVEIYEGDIIQGGTRLADEVIFRDGLFQTAGGYRIIYTDSVIGNIYENAELLEGDNE